MKKIERESPLVSIMLPCYNCEEYVEEAVRSIINQTYQKLEILCTDDCSKDNTYEILERIARTDSRIILQRHKENRGIVDTLNEMIELASGEYIGRMDADDISMPNRIEKQVAFLINNPEIDICGTQARIIDETGRVFSRTILPETEEEHRAFLPYFSTVSHPTVLARREFYKQNYYDKEFLHAEDYEMWLRAVFAEKRKICNIPELLLDYRVNSKSVSSNNSEVQRRMSATAVQKYCNDMVEDMEAHLELFFLKNYQMDYRIIQKEMDVARESVLDQDMELQASFYERLVWYCYKCSMPFKLMRLISTKPGFRAIRRILQRKINMRRL